MVSRAFARVMPLTRATVTGTLASFVLSSRARAMMVVVPSATGVTVPVASTDATPTSADDQCTALSQARSVSTVATRRRASPPTKRTGSTLGVTATPRTLHETTAVTVAVLPSMVAVMLVLPAPTEVTTARVFPVLPTVATEGFEDENVTARSRGCPPGPDGVAVRFCVWPGPVNESCPGDRATDATAVGTEPPPPPSPHAAANASQSVAATSGARGGRRKEPVRNMW